MSGSGKSQPYGGVASMGKPNFTSMGMGGQRAPGSMMPMGGGYEQRALQAGMAPPVISRPHDWEGNPVGGTPAPMQQPMGGAGQPGAMYRPPGFRGAAMTADQAQQHQTQIEAGRQQYMNTLPAGHGINVTAPKVNINDWRVPAGGSLSGMEGEMPRGMGGPPQTIGGVNGGPGGAAMTAPRPSMVQGPGGAWGKYSPGGNWHPNTNNRFGAAPMQQPIGQMQPGMGGQGMGGAPANNWGAGPGVYNSPTVGGSGGGGNQLSALLSQLFGRR